MMHHMTGIGERCGCDSCTETRARELGWYPASGVNEWLLGQRDKLRAAQTDLRAREQTREVLDELLRIEGALAAVQTAWGYFGKMWGR